MHYIKKFYLLFTSSDLKARRVTAQIIRKNFKLKILLPESVDDAKLNYQSQNSDKAKGNLKKLLKVNK